MGNDGRLDPWVPGLLVPSTVGRVRLAPLIPLIAPWLALQGLLTVGRSRKIVSAYDGLAFFALSFHLSSPCVWDRLSHSLEKGNDRKSIILMT